MKIITSLLVASTIALNAQVLATVNSEDVSKNDVENFLKATNSDIAYDKMDSKAKNLALHQTIEKTLLIQEAKKEKLDKSKDFLQTLEDFKKSLLVEQFMKSEFSKIKISKEEVENYYNAHLYEFQQDKKLKARHILVEDLKKALDITKELEASKNKEISFVELASKYSIDGSREKGGDIGWFKKGDMIDEFWDASLALKPQEFTKEPVKSMFGYHIIFLDEIQEPLTIKLEQVYSNIENQIRMDKFQTIIDEKIKNIKKDAQITIK
jgi:peptidylprolyl isomerase